MTHPSPIGVMFKELEATPGVEFRPVTDNDKQRVQPVLQALAVADNAGAGPADDKGGK